MSVLEKVPWTSYDEWEYCRDNLFGEDMFMKRKALDHLYVWRVRAPTLPVAVECTLILMEVHLKGCDRNVDNEEMFTNTMNYESWYSVAIMRFLNLVLDSSGGGSKIVPSLSQLAKMHAIPDWIVDMRNAVAHGPVLPSLSSLKEATEICLKWLKDSYWTKTMYEDEISNEDNTTASLTFSCFELCLMVKKYLLFGFESMLSIPLADRQKINRALPKFTEDKLDYIIERWPLIEVYQHVLKKLGRHLKRSPDHGKKLVFSILETDEYLLSSDAVKNNQISEDFLNEWSDILTVICDSKICSYFLQELTNVVVSPVENAWRQHCAALHLNKILENILQWEKANSQIKDIENNCVKQKKRKKTPASSFRYGNDGTKQILQLNDLRLTEEDILMLIQIVLDKPNEFTNIFFKNLICISKSSQYCSKYPKLSALIDIYTGSRTDIEHYMETDDNYTVQQITGEVSLPTPQSDSEETSDKMSSRYPENEENGVVSEEFEWKNTPLGILPWQTAVQSWLHIYDSK